jgi:hypothetical protein
MKKIIRLTESDLYRIVKKVIKEQSEFDPKTASYFAGATNDLSPKPALYFVKEGDSYQAWVEVKKSNSERNSFLSLGLLPKAETLTATIDNSNRIVLTGPSVIANEIYSEMFGGTKGVAVVLNGEPYLANMFLSGVVPDAETALKTMTSVEPKLGNQITKDKSFFITVKPNVKKGNYGKGSEIKLNSSHTVQEV